MGAYASGASMGNLWLLICFALLDVFAAVFAAKAEPVPVHHTLGLLHGYLVLKDSSGKVLASGEAIYGSAGNHVRSVLSLHFRDGSLFEETSVFSQSKTFQLLTYKRVLKGPAFKRPEILSFDTSSGDVDIQYRDKDGKPKHIAKQISLPSDLANGILTTVLSGVDPKAETTLSMLVATPDPRVVKLHIATAGQDSFRVADAGYKAWHYVIKIEIGGVAGAVAKVAGEQPPPIHIWVAAGSAPIFLRSEGPLYEDGPIWQVELASPVWPKASRTH